MNLHRVFCLVVIVIVTWLAACSSDEVATPKPKAYFRISVPEKKYRVYDSVCPFIFEMPTYSFLEKDPSPNAEACWMNLVYQDYNAKLHLSYRSVKNDLPKILDNTYELAAKHQVKASGMKTFPIVKEQAKVYGLIYLIEGNAACPLQFFVTDSTQHYLRGALYFNAPPNADSIAPVFDFLKADVLKLIESFRWKSSLAGQ
jgi:gliding motility-associated lipoprotein GldD